ncbi:MAG TPA: metalloregulator ArsR/SmtB family transcription factor [Drouetiella sp.]
MSESQEAPPAICKQLSAEEINAQLIDQGKSAGLENLFKILANETRLRILHALSISGEMCVNDLSATLDMKNQAISNQLQKLAGSKVVATRRSGVNIYYRIVDPCVSILLERALCMLESSNTERSSESQQQADK